MGSHRNGSGLPWQCRIVIAGLLLGGLLMISIGIKNSVDISRFNSTAVQASGTVTTTEYHRPTEVEHFAGIP